MKQEAPWEILGISEDATEEEIGIAHRRMAAKYHPDKAPGATPEIRELAAEMTKKINNARDEMIRRLEARKNASHNYQSPPRNEQGASHTTYSYPGDAPPLSVMERLQMLVATVGFKRILQVLAVIAPMALGFFQGIRGDGPRPERRPGPDPDAEVLKQPYSDMQFEIPQARIEEDRLVVSMIVRNAGGNKLMEFSLYNFAQEAGCDRCPESDRDSQPNWPKYTLEKAVVNGKTDQSPIIIQSPEGHAVRRYLRCLGHVETKLELVYSMHDAPYIQTAKKLNTFNLSLRSGSNSSETLFFRNIPIKGPMGQVKGDGVSIHQSFEGNVMTYASIVVNGTDDFFLADIRAREIIKGRHLGNNSKFAVAQREPRSRNEATSNAVTAQESYLERRRVFWRALFLYAAYGSTWRSFNRDYNQWEPDRRVGENDPVTGEPANGVRRRLLKEIGPYLRNPNGSQPMPRAFIGELADAYRWLMAEYNPIMGIRRQKGYQETAEETERIKGLYMFIRTELNLALPKDDNGNPKPHDNHVLTEKEAEAVSEAFANFVNIYYRNTTTGIVAQAAVQKINNAANEVLRLALEISDNTKEPFVPVPQPGDEKQAERALEMLMNFYQEQRRGQGGIPRLLLPENLPPPPPLRGYRDAFYASCFLWSAYYATNAEQQEQGNRSFSRQAFNDKLAQLGGRVGLSASSIVKLQKYSAVFAGADGNVGGTRDFETNCDAVFQSLLRTMHPDADPKEFRALRLQNEAGRISNGRTLLSRIVQMGERTDTITARSPNRATAVEIQKTAESICRDTRDLIRGDSESKLAALIPRLKITFFKNVGTPLFLPVYRRMICA